MRLRRTVLPILTSAAGLLAACASQRSAPPLVAPPAVVLPDQPGLTFILAWDAPVDLDLYVTDPTWETVYFGNNPSRSGARLTEDVRCPDVRGDGPFQEVVRIADPAPGGYRVGVDFMERCRGENEYVSFRVATVFQGAAAQEKSGAIQIERFLPRVAEYRFTGTGLVAADLADGESATRSER